MFSILRVIVHTIIWNWQGGSLLWLKNPWSCKTYRLQTIAGFVVIGDCLVFEHSVNYSQQTFRGGILFINFSLVIDK